MITIIKPGLLSSIQDLGRFGLQKYGVISSGAMDVFSHRVANLLTGNDENTPTIEMTLLGPVVLFHKDALIAICGGEFTPSINGHPIPTWKPVLVKKGTILHCGRASQGCRAYLAVSGGLSVPILLNSRSTYLRANIGGFHGRALQAGDEIPFRLESGQAKILMKRLYSRMKGRPFAEANWYVSPNLIPTMQAEPIIRAMIGRQYHLFTPDSQEGFFQQSFTVTAQSDRMGYRLIGTPLSLKKPEEMLSAAVAFGTIQVPSDGNPIVLLADRQTTGGYPIMAQIASIDFSIMAQARPGDRIHFRKITHEDAQRLYIKKERETLLLKQSIMHKMSQEVLR
nr:biotin-dependent carboxyltransferase family protein [uncultured Bacillus sp.]